MVKQTVSVGVSIWTRILRFVDKLDLTIGITSILLLVYISHFPKSNNSDEIKWLSVIHGWIIDLTCQ